MKKDDKQKSRESILAASAKLFSQQGFNGTSFAAVAKQAEQSKALVQYHFETKERLWKETVAYIWDKRDGAMPNYMDEAVFNQLDPSQQKQMIRLICKGLIRFIIDNPEWVKIMYQEAAIPGPRLDWMIETFFTEDIRQGKALIEFAQSLNLLPQIDPMSLLYILAGAVFHYVDAAPITSKVLGADMFSDEQVDHYIDNFILLMEGALALKHS